MTTFGSGTFGSGTFGNPTAVLPDPATATRSPNRLSDLVTGASYAWAINHLTEDPLDFSREYDDWRQQSASSPARFRFQGTILEPEQLDSLLSMYEACDDRTLLFEDYTGDSYEVVIVLWDARPERAYNPRTRDVFIWRYTVEMEIVTVLNSTFLPDS